MNRIMPSALHSRSLRHAPAGARAPALNPGLRITAAHTHFPGQQYTTADVRARIQPDLRAASQRLVRLGAPSIADSFGPRILERLGVHTRALAIDPGAPREFWQRQRNNNPMARAGADCYRSLMAGRAPLSADDKVIVVSNAYDTTCPNLVTHILNQLQRDAPGFVYPHQLSLLGEGCSGFISALREANTFLGANPRARVVIVADELTSHYFHNPDLLEALLVHAERADSHEERTEWAKIVRGLFIQRLLFGDGVVAVMCQSDRVVDSGLRLNRFRRYSNLHPDDIDIFGIRGVGTEGAPVPPFGYFYQDARRLFARLKEAYIPAMAQGLAGVGAQPDAFAIHTGSGPILDEVCQGLNIAPEHGQLSADILYRHGNMNTASGAAITAALLHQRDGVPVRPFLAFFGVGFTAQIAYYQPAGTANTTPGTTRAAPVKRSRRSRTRGYRPGFARSRSRRIPCP